MDWKEEFEYRFHSWWEVIKDFVWVLPYAVIVAILIAFGILAISG